MIRTKINKCFIRIALILSLVLVPMIGQDAVAAVTSADNQTIGHMSMEHMSMAEASEGGMEMPVNCEDHCADENNSDQSCPATCLQINTAHFANIVAEFVDVEFVVTSHVQKNYHMEHLAKIGFSPPPPRS